MPSPGLPASNWRNAWSLADDVVYLNHGSFGPSPKVVQDAREEWTRRLERQPMDFFVRRLETHLDAAIDRLAKFVDADPHHLVFMDNATAAMNVVAATVELQAGDEVLCTDHEYGAVLRIWRTACARAGAHVVVQRLAALEASDDELVDSLMAGATDRTRLIAVSHVTSPTAVILPVEGICRRAAERRIPVCIDGPHSLAMLPVSLRQLDCDFYCASGHKWLSAPFGSGCLYVARRWHNRVRPAVVSWGGSLAGRPPSWKDEFNWAGTRDPAACLAIPAAIDFLERCGVEAFRDQTHELARYAAVQISKITGIEPLAPESRYGSMVALPLPGTSGTEPLPQGRRDPLQEALWQKHRIEVPIPHWHGRRLLRVSCHLYNSTDDIDRLVSALREELRSGL